MASNSTLLPVRDQGWLQGFSNLLNKENRSWWTTRSWILQTLLWMLIVNGIVAMILWGNPQADFDPNQPAQDVMALTLFFTMAALAPAVGAVIRGQEAVIHEKQTGTAAWVLSKPASRSAFILSKMTAHALGILVTVVLIQGAVAYLLIAAATGVRYAVLPFLGGLGLTYLALLFYLALTLMLGTIFSARGPVIGIPMLVIFGYQLFLGVAPWLGKVMPWALTISFGETQDSLAVALTRGQPLATLTPIIATAIWIVLFTGVAIWRFNREEF